VSISAFFPSRDESLEALPSIVATLAAPNSNVYRRALAEYGSSVHALPVTSNTVMTFAGL